MRETVNGASRDIAQLHRILNARSHSAQVMVRATDEAAYLADVCHIITSDCGYAMAWIGFTEDDVACTVRPVASAGFDDGYLDTVRISWADTERGRGPTGTAIRTGQPAICRNMLTDPLFAPWREQALKRGYASSIVLPLRSDGHVFGAISIYAREPDPFSAEEIDLLAQLADDLSYGIQAIRLRIAHARTTEALARSEERYRSLFNGMTEGFALHEIICDDHGVPCDYRFLDINPAFERLTGLRRDDVIGKTHNALLPNDDPRWVQEYGAVVLTGTPVQFVNFSPALNRHYEVFAYRPAPGQFAVLFMDITERKRVEEEVARRMAELEAIFVAQHDAVLIYDTTLRVQQANPSFQATYGFDPVGLQLADLADRVCCRCLDGQPLLWEAQPTPRALQGEVVTGACYAVTCADDTEMVVEASSSPMRLGDRIVGVVTVWHDITERIRQASALQQAKEEWERTFDSVPDLIAILDDQHRIVRANKAMTERLALTPLACTGACCFESVHGTHAPPANCPHRQTLVDGKTHTAEVHEDRLGGDYLVSTTPLYDAHGKMIGSVHVARDITARKRMEEALRQTAAELTRSNQELEQFAYVASHDLQEPLRAVSGYVSLIEAQLQDTLDARTRRHIDGAVQGAARMQQLITDLLLLSRVGTQGKDFEQTPMQAVLDQALQRLSVSVQETGATITHDPLPTLVVDAGQMTQLFQNLIANAIKFHGEQTSAIHITVEQQPEQVLFAVRDNGIGIDPQYFQRIFMIFQRLHTRTQYPGTGIGLAICKKIVERHGGTIWVESQPGAGATFYFTLPNRDIA